MQGGRLRTYVITAMISLYFNVFVLIAQSFMKVPALQLVLCVVLTVLAVKKFRPA
jgi:hypothetical protein